MLLVQNPSFQSLPPSLRSKSVVRFTIYPQPSSTSTPLSLELQRGLKREASLRVTNQNGKPVFEGAAQAPQHTLKDLEPGTYYFEINDGFYCQIKELEIK